MKVKKEWYWSEKNWAQEKNVTFIVFLGVTEKIGHYFLNNHPSHQYNQLSNPHN